ncbi:MAG: HlyD family efflux transporter periplasmic adaptor subunit [Gemmatimonadota bacterium]
MRWKSLALGVAGLWACRSASDALVGHGTIEVTEVHMASMVAARVVSVRVDEGSQVRKGDTLATLTQTDLPASIAAQEARVATAAANLRDLEAGARPQELHRAQAERDMAAAEAERAARDLERIRALAVRDVVGEQQLDQAVLAARMADEQHRASEQSLALLAAGARAERVVAARADVAAARSTLEMYQARASDLVLVAPVDGQVLARFADPGEVLGPNVAALTVGETTRPYVRVFVRADAVARLAVGDSATITIDAGPPIEYRGRIAAINPKSEFTPRVALTENERADLMFGVKVEITKPDPKLHPGLWVTVRFEPGGADGRTAAQ